MRIDTTTLLFHDLTDEEAKELRAYGERNMLQDVPGPLPPIVLRWMEECGFSADQGLLVVFTVLPARIFYSLLLRVEGREKTLHERIAQCLGWTVDQLQSFSLTSLRDLVQPVSKELAEEITKEIKSIRGLAKSTPWPLR